MDERSFVEQKQESWKRLSETLDQIRDHGAKSVPSEQLQTLAAQYRAVVSDLSFVRTQGASDGLVRYLNELAGRAHGAVYASRSAKLSGAFNFLVREFPEIFRRTFNYTLVAALLFFLGWGLSATNPEIRDSAFPGTMQQPSRQSQTDSPLADSDPAFLSSFIVTNNIREGIMAFIGGITVGLFTIYVLLKNGVVIGAVASKANAVMGPVKFWSLILPHGVIELTAIFICGGAGLLIGAAIVAPGNLRRADAVRQAATKGIRLVAGALLFFVVAGTIEGFITPSRLPGWSKLVFAGVTAIALIIYLGFVGRRSEAAES